MSLLKIIAGDKIWFTGDKKPYVAHGAGERFILCLKRKYKGLMTIRVIDMWDNIYWDHSFIGIWGDHRYDEYLMRLHKGQLKVKIEEHRNLNISLIESKHKVTV